MISNIDNILDFIKGSNDFVVTSHISPDGDNIGSTLGTYYFLKRLGKNVYYVLDDNAPLNLEFLLENVPKMSSEDFKALNIDNFSLIALDCGDKRRVCVSDEIKDKALKVICIDHHASNDSYGDLNYIDTEASSTSELVYNLIVRFNELNNTNIIDENIATALYTGLVTDTGNFSYSSTHPSSFEMAKELIILGAKKEMIIQNVFQSNSYNYYKLLGEALNLSLIHI